MLGWVSIFALWDTCSGCQYHCSGKLQLLIRFLFLLNPTSTNPTLLHVKPVNAAASRASSLRLNLIIKQDWQPYPVDPYSCYMCDDTYMYRKYML